MTSANEHVSGILHQIKHNTKMLSLAFVPIILCLIAIYVFSQKTGISTERFVKDPAALFRAHPMTGIVSNIGILLWCVTTTICFVAAYLHNNTEKRWFMACSGAISAILLMDDLLMMHEYIFPTVLGIDEKAFYVFYGLITLAYLARFKAIILTYDYSILMLAYGFLGMSVITDLVLAPGDAAFLIEDGAKIIGIISWMLFFSGTLKGDVQTLAGSQFVDSEAPGHSHDKVSSFSI